MKKIILLLYVVLGVVVGGVFGAQFFQPEQNTKKVSQESASVSVSPTEKPKEVPGLPQRVIIPKLQIDTAVEQVGLDNEGKMDVPENADNVGWYKLGYKPGEKGSAVMAGHNDKVTGAPAVFYKLSLLQIGDKIEVIDDKGKKYLFQVSQTQAFPYSDYPLQKVFGPNDNNMLNLITCNGVWDASTKNYSNRLTVFAKLVSSTLNQ